VIEQLNEANFGWFEPHSFDSESLESNDLILFGVHGGRRGQAHLLIRLKVFYM